MTGTTDRLIINNPYEEPKRYLKYNREIRKFEVAEGRRPAGYIVASESGAGTFDDPGKFVPLDLANRIRDRVAKWRDAGYTWKNSEITSVTRLLLEHWKNPQREIRLFFCQIEA